MLRGARTRCFHSDCVWFVEPESFSRPVFFSTLVSSRWGVFLLPPSESPVGLGRGRRLSVEERARLREVVFDPLFAQLQACADREAPIVHDMLDLWPPVVSQSFDDTFNFAPGSLTALVHFAPDLDSAVELLRQASEVHERFSRVIEESYAPHALRRSQAINFAALEFDPRKVAVQLALDCPNFGHPL